MQPGIMPAPAMPLRLAVQGRRLRLQRLTGDARLQTHLASLGFVPGAEVEVISRNLPGPLIVAIKAGRLMLGDQMARHIWVE